MSTNEYDTNNGNQIAYDGSKVEVIVMVKSDKTLKSNINAKDDTMRKRTSLRIVPHQQQEIDEDENCNDKNADIDNCIDTRNGNDRVSDIIEKIEKMKTNIKNAPLKKPKNANARNDEQERKKDNVIISNAIDNKNSNRNSIGSMDSCESRSCSNTSRNSSTSSNTSSTSDDEVHIEDYQDLENGNMIDDLDESDRKNCISNASSCIDDYSLREKLHNFVNDSMIKSNGGGNSTSDDADEANILEDDVDDPHQQPRSLPMHCEVLLSPHEAPMGRRYAEVAQFKR